MTSFNQKSVELLAPVGDSESLNAAIANGANAVYLGAQQFNARMRARNFSIKDLATATALCHAHNVKLYLALNTLIFPDEIEQAISLVDTAANAGVNAIIVQDLGLARHIKSRYPSMPLHASTQMTLTEPEAINALQQQLQLQRLILPREVSIDEMADIRQNTSLELEAFIHGALCISYSGQCHASLFMGGRSANRGACAQPCRLPYTMTTKTGGARPHPTQLLSPKDLCGIHLIPEMLRAGISCFKIEGRLKGALYTAATTRAYRRAIDHALSNTPANHARDLQAMSILFSRGLSEGHLRGTQHADLVDSRISGHQGLLLGHVREISNTSIVIDTEKDLHFPPTPGDGIAFGHPVPNGSRPGARIYQARHATATNTYELQFGRGDLDFSKIQEGQSVWKTSDPKLEHELNKTYSKLNCIHTCALRLRFETTDNAPARLHGATEDGLEHEVESETIPEKARTRPLDKERLTQQIDRLTSTPFHLEKVELLHNGSPVDQTDHMIPKSMINDMRRRLIENLVEQRTQTARHIRSTQDLDTIPPGPHATTTPPIRILVRTPQQLGQLIDLLPLDHRSDYGIYADLELKHQQAGLDTIRQHGFAAGLVSPRIITAEQRHIIEQQIAMQPDLYLARNISSLIKMHHSTHPAQITADYTLNASNSHSAQELVKLGASLISPALDLPPEAREQLAEASPYNWEQLVYFHPGTFFTQYCLFAHHLGTGKSYPECGQTCKRETIRLTDRKEASYQVIRDAAGRQQYFAEKPARPYRRTEDPLHAEVLRIELLDETDSEIFAILEDLHALRKDL